MGCSPSAPNISRSEFEARFDVLQKKIFQLESELSDKRPNEAMQSHHGGAPANADPAPSRDDAKTKQRRFPRRAAAPGDVSLGEAASYRPETVAECWQLADATCARLGGDAKKRAAATKARRGWKTIRLFVSSTFTDFYSEREALVKEVFPDLKAWCQARKLHLVECDLRWGVPKDTTSEETLRTCLSEIDRCFEDNAEPFFLNMISERTGWIPEPSEVPGLLAAQYGWIHGLSVTEMEIMHGAYRKKNANALFMIRNPSFLTSVFDDVKYLFVDSNPIAGEKLKALKKAIQKRFPNQSFNYSAMFSNVDSSTGRPELKGLEDFKATVYRFFKEKLEAAYPLDNTSSHDVVESQRIAHEIFVDSRGGTVLGREEILDEIQSYINGSGRSTTPLILVGSAGAGKSAVMARSAVTTLGNAKAGAIPGAGLKTWRVFYHFIGAAPGSTDIGHLLQRLLRELKFMRENVPSDIEKLVQETNRALADPDAAPSILYIDALNQLDDDLNAKSLKWLPEVLSSNVRVVLSMINQTDYHRSLASRSNSPQQVFCGPLNLSARRAIITETFARYNKRLDDSQMRLLLSKDGSANPLWLSLACEELRLFGSFERVLDKIRELADDLLSLLQQILSRLEEENGGHLVIATLCLLECSRHGLLESELLVLLGDEGDILPPEDGWLDVEAATGGGADDAHVDVDAIVADLKAEVEMTYRTDAVDKLASQLESTGIDSSVAQPKRFSEPLAAAKWSLVYRGLRQFLRPCGDSGEGRLDFYHRTMSKAIRLKYFAHDDKAFTKFQYTWWHGKLAGFFESVDDMDRRSEELPYHLEKLLDHSRLARCLVEWPMFDRLFEEQSRLDLLKSWRKAGGYKAASACYREALSVLRKSDSCKPEELSLRLEKVARFLSLAGEYSDAFALLEEAQRIAESHLGSEPERMADLYYALADTKSEVAKLQDFIDSNTAVQSKAVIDLARKSIEIRKTLPGDENAKKLGLAYLLTSFHLSSFFQARGKTPDLTSQQAKEQGVEMAREAIKIFQQLGDGERLAEAYMVIGLHIDSKNPNQLEYLQKGLSLCLRSCGRYHMLTARFHINIGIYHEDNGDYFKAYEYFKDWAEICTEVYGPSHPKTKRAKGTLEEPMYAKIRMQLEHKGHLDAQ